ncbi:MAG: T9SS type A sorting domain-containing protein [Ignavibacteriales bacterium]|nr:T9SS type A sorting domain-containing protein [Ignavibacteriales bacterium]
MTELKGGNFLIVDNDNIYLTSDEGLYYSNNSGTSWSLRLDSTNALELSTMPKVNSGWGFEVDYYNGTARIHKYEDTAYVPVELTSFLGSVKENKILLNWKTATELNNKAFEIQRSQMAVVNDQTEWVGVGFVPGFGTTTEPKSYSFIDDNLFPGKYRYRLKQIDFDGSFEYSNTIEIEVPVPIKFTLIQNYPNPFNPITKITFEIPFQTEVRITLYDITGQEIKTLTNQKYEAGFHSVVINADDLSSGVYLYRMTTLSGYTAVKKLTIIK